MKSADLEFPSAETTQSPGSPVQRRSPRWPGWRFLLVVLTLVTGGTWLLAQGQPTTRFSGGPQPAFGTLTASPSSIVSDTPTTVTFTIRIDTPTLNPTTVDLQRVAADGQFLETMGRMFDNGQAGDQTPGDRVFTAQVMISESVADRLHFRVGAAFRGVEQNSLSSTISVGMWQQTADSELRVSFLTPPNWEVQSGNGELELFAPESQALPDGPFLPADILLTTASMTAASLAEYVATYRGGWYNNYSCAPVASGAETILCSSELSLIPRTPALAAFVRIDSDRLVLVFGTNSSPETFRGVLRSIRPF